MARRNGVEDLQAILSAATPMRIHRSRIKNAPYNPRTITDKARKKLEAGMRRHGLISLPTWNERSGNLVGGHQRLAILDSIAGSEDYELDVVRVDMDDTHEREANLLLNNDAVTGDFDLGKLNEILADTKIELVGTGFDAAEIYRLLGDAPGRSAVEIEAMADSLRKARESYDQILRTSDRRDGVDFYLVVVFRDVAHRDEFTSALGLDDNRYQDGSALLALYQGRGAKT